MARWQLLLTNRHFTSRVVTARRTAVGGAPYFHSLLIKDNACQILEHNQKTLHRQLIH